MWRITTWVPIASGLMMLCLAAAPLPKRTTVLASVASDGSQAMVQMSAAPALSRNGRVVVFFSRAANLAPDDPNGDGSDIFVRDLRRAVTTRVSVGPGAGGNGSAFDPAISADGRHVAFDSSASDLVPVDTNGLTDVFVYDRAEGSTMRISLGPGNAESDGYSAAPTMSAGGDVVAYVSDATVLVSGDTNLAADVFAWSRSTGGTTRVSVGPGGSEANGDSEEPALSGNGRYVGFASYASTLVIGDSNGEEDVFVHDRTTGVTSRVSVASGGGQAQGGGSDYPSVSKTGRFVAFSSEATNLVPEDTNGERDVFVHDRKRRITTRVSVSSEGLEGTGGSSEPRISASGRWVAFQSFAPNLVADDANAAFDVFVYDRKTGITRRVSTSYSGGDADDWSFQSALASSGRVVAFVSDATNVVSSDTNGTRDVFVRRW